VFETSRKRRISDIISDISSGITSDLGYHETATLNKSLVILKSGVKSRVRVATSFKSKEIYLKQNPTQEFIVVAKYLHQRLR
jgi:hypothetical protein